MAKRHQSRLLGEGKNVVKREVTKAAGFVSIYTNDIQVQTSPWDMRLLLGEISRFPTHEDAVLGINLLGEVRLSPQCARRFVAIMLEQLNGYEERFGKIPAAVEAVDN